MDEELLLKQEFFLEAREQLDMLSTNVMKVEAEPDNKEHLSAVYRIAHTIKGACGFLGFQNIGEFTHNFEELLSALRDKRINVSADLIDLILEGGDYLTSMIDTQEQGKEPEVNEELISKFKSYYEKKNISETKDESVIEAQQLKTESEPENEAINEEYLTEFIIGAMDMLHLLEKATIEYEKQKSSDSINEIFRIIHTIKGDSAYIGLTNLVKFTHALESLLSGLRSNPTKCDADTIDLILISIDFIKAYVLDITKGERTIALPDFYYSRLQKYSGEKIEEKQQVQEQIVIDDSIESQVFVEQALQHRDNLVNTIKELPLNDVKIKNIKRTFEDLQRSSKFMEIKIFDGNLDIGLNAISAKDNKQLMTSINHIITFIGDIEKGPKRLGEILVDTGKLSNNDIEEALAKQKNIGDILIDSGKVKQEDIALAVKKQNLMNIAGQVKSKDTSVQERKTIRVDEQKIENFTSLIGELLIAKNAYEYIVNKINVLEGNDISEFYKNLSSNVHLFTRLTNDMQYGIMALRMIPIRGIFQKFNRVVRTVSRKQNKEIEYLMEGADTEIDKKVADILSDPLIHLIRNSCDHGIEEPATRLAAGKPKKGTVTLSASQMGSNLSIKIKDDGKGLNRQLLYDKAVSKGLNPPPPDDDEIFNVIFNPGFSTNEIITDISGRGVGMDVVNSTLKTLSGEVNIESEEGVGTEITLSIPTSMGISSVLVVEFNKEAYAIPLEYVVETIKIPFKKLRPIHDRIIFYYRGNVINVESMGDLLSGKSEYFIVNKDNKFNDEDEISIVVMKVGNKRVGIIVDKFDRNLDIAIKPTPDALAKIEIISGVSIMGNGKVIIVLNPLKLI